MERSSCEAVSTRGSRPGAGVPQGSVVADRSKARGTRGQRQPAQRLPVAEVCVDVPLAHLDRPFDYLVTVEQDADAMPGVRVRVRFAGKLVDGFLLRRKENSTHHGRLAYLERVTSAERVLTDEIAVLARAVADRYAGTMIDVLRLAIPPRHAAAEKKPSAERPPSPAPPSTDGWQ
ncbi:MAG: primosome assembly protein PriA, partial [Sciscionella sp.]|nr:primosome assembly protein PriA [Sciscionella sp.]